MAVRESTGLMIVAGIADLNQKSWQSDHGAERRIVCDWKDHPR